MRNRKYTAVVIGCGRGGENIGVHSIGYVHGKAYYQHEQIELAGACDLNSENLQRYCDHFSIPFGTADSERLFEQVRPEIVSLCTYVSSRPALLEASIRHGAKAIWCEKPFALTIQEGRRLAALCEENGVKLIINHYRRYLDLWNRTKNLVKEGEIGELQLIYGSFDGWDQMEMGTHLLDMIRYIVDDQPVSWVMGQVRCTGKKIAYGHTMEEHSACYLAFENGVRGFYDASMHFPGKNLFRLNGSKGYIDVFPTGEIILTNARGLTKTVADSDWSNPKENGQDPFQHLLNDFLGWIEGGEPPRINGQSGLASTELYLACYESSKRRDRIDLPLREQDGFPLDAISLNLH
jgi:UDP-N-acetylglucosamine 3-dehydrogenase